MMCCQQVDLVVHTYSNKYGTFLGNSQREREVLRLNDNTESVWELLNVNNTLYVNHLYEQLEKVSNLGKTALAHTKQSL